MTLNAVMLLMLSNYLFKLAAALIDTPLIYLAARKLRPYLGLETSNGRA